MRINSWDEFSNFFLFLSPQKAQFSLSHQLLKFNSNLCRANTSFRRIDLYLTGRREEKYINTQLYIIKECSKFSTERATTTKIALYLFLYLFLIFLWHLATLLTRVSDEIFHCDTFHQNFLLFFFFYWSSFSKLDIHSFEILQIFQ